MGDCNYCPYINLTESEQNDMRGRGLDIIPHICLKYNKQVVHRNSNPKHNGYLYPCEECEVDEHDGN